MTIFNPSAPGTVGMEWMPSEQVPQALSPVTPIGAQFTAIATESIASISAFLRGGALPLQVDVYDIADPLVDTPQAIYAKPVSTFTNAAEWFEFDAPPPTGSGASPDGTLTGYASDAWTYVDDYVSLNFGLPASLNANKLAYRGVSPSLVAQILFHAGGSGSGLYAVDMFDYDDGTPVPTPGLTGRRIVSVDVVAIVDNNTNFGGTWFDAFLNIGGLRFGSDSGRQLIVQGTNLTRCTFSFALNPKTKQPWTNADAVALSDGTDAFGVGVLTKPQPGFFRVTALALVFHTRTADRRKASGHATGPGSQIGQWTSFALEDPTTGAAAPWAKAVGHTYAVVVSIVGENNPGQAQLVSCDTANLVGHEVVPPPNGWFGVSIPTIHGAPSGAPVLSLIQPAMYMVTAGAALGADIQPYVAPNAMLCSTTTGACRQSITGLPGSATPYGIIGAVILSVPNQTPTAPLTVKIMNATGPAQVGGSMTILPGDIPTDGLAHLISHVMASSASLSSSGTFYLEFSTTSTVPWAIVGAFCGNPASATIPASTEAGVAAAGSYGGVATWDGHAEPTLDIHARVVTVPAGPGGLAVTVGTKTLNPAPPGGPTTIKYASVDWTSTSLGAAFGYYELQRSDDNTTFETIAVITAEAQSGFPDMTCRRNVIQYYRVRVVRSDGAPSDWSV